MIYVEFVFCWQEGDVISLTERLNDEWLRGRLHGVEGMFPYNYVRIVVPLDATSTPQGIPVNLTVVALFPFIAQTWDDLDLNVSRFFFSNFKYASQITETFFKKCFQL